MDGALLHQYPFARQIQNLEPSEVHRFLHTRETGLNAHEVSERLTEIGPNMLAERRRLVWLKSLVRQFTNFFTILLEVAAAICFTADHIQPGEGMNVLGWALLGVSVLNAMFSFVQEYRAERAMEELRKFLPQRVRVTRGGEDVEILAEQLVPGDVLAVREGDKIPADARLFEVQDLIVSNAPLTGEAHAVRLQAQAQECILTESVNILFAGCMVKKGRGEAVVFATGARTEFGKVAMLSHEVKRKASPLERETQHMVRVMATIASVTSILFFTISFISGETVWTSLVNMMVILVAMVPEGLLPTMTLSLAMASLHMAKRNVLVKSLNAVEALGAVHVICTDKTGTLTQNLLAVTSLKGALCGDLSNAARKNALAQALVASDVRESELGFSGDPLDVALAEAFQAMRGDVAQVLGSVEKEFSFDDEKRRAAGVAEMGGRRLFCVKGAWESLCPMISHAEDENGHLVVWDTQRIAQAEAQMHAMASLGQRVIALAYREVEGADGEQAAYENNLVLKAFIGAEDPIRAEVPGAVLKCHKAGIRVVMITGDHPETAEAVARRVGIVAVDAAPGACVLTGAELARIGRAQLVKKLQDGISVFARTTPEQKWKIVSAFHDLNQVVAVTGDGVNDAPALKAADVGIAMGQGGTDVAREAAQVILLDDNFASIVHGIEEGRTIFNNIQKFTSYVMVSNAPEIVAVMAYILLPIPLPLMVGQILSIDLGTNIIPSMGLGHEDSQAELMEIPPRTKKQGLVTTELLIESYLFLGLIEAAFAMSLFFYVLYDGGWIWGADLDARDPLYLSATGITLSSIILMQIGNLFGRRSRLGSGLSLDFLRNPWIVGGIVFEVVFSWAILFFPPVANVLGTGPVDTVVYAVAWCGPFLIYGLDYARKRLVVRFGASAA
ncbi:MAG: cation-transporting P-type ATPase [Rhodospirillales bacterium]|nr:cation-transporting P-type ATPase [Rhodospirillales bacterium]